MNIFNTNRTIFWILVFLVLINLSALATYFLFIRKTTGESVTGNNAKNGITLKQELSLTPDQILKVTSINKTYNATGESIALAIKEKKADLLVELSKNSSDSNQIINLVDDIVKDQKKLQMANIKQFLDLKKVCTPEQTQKLSRIYSELYGCENNTKGRGKGNGKGFRHRYGQQRDTLTR